ncbi:putative ADP-ribosylation factor GTPase-activating protein AGD14 [Glycine soja]
MGIPKTLDRTLPLPFRDSRWWKISVSRVSVFLIWYFGNGKQKGRREERENYQRSHEASAESKMYQLQQLGTTICMYEFLDFHFREFTHRVKSVSMAKFTSQEVDALQNGGNQRARELYLKNWDFQRQRLPDNSNVDKIREFIRSVYSPGIHEDEIRRASSYHSYSQSPPYDYQYEDRRYGKQVAALTRKPGSDKARYKGKMSSIIYSPDRFSDHVYDDRFANERSGPRISDFSVSSGGEQLKSDVQSPNFHKDIKISSPSYQRRSGTSSSEDVWSQARNASLEINANAKRDVDGIRPPQRTASAQSTDNKFSSLRSYNSGSLADFFSEPVQASEPLQNRAFGIPRPPGPTRSVSMDFSKAPLESASSVDPFQFPAAPSAAPTVDLFQSSVSSAAPSFNENQLTQTSQLASIDFFADFSEQPSTVTSDGKALGLSVPKNKGWATFDMPQSTSSAAQVEIPATVPSSAKSIEERFDPFSTSHANVQQWPSFEISSVNAPSSVISNLRHDGVWNGEEQVSAIAENTKPWNAFEDSGDHHHLVDGLSQGLQLHNFPSADNHILGLIESEGSNEDEVKGIAPVGRFDNHDIPSHVSGSAYPPPMLPPMGDIQHNETKSKSTNPFDYPYETDVDHNNMFLDMGSLQAALPDALFPATFHGGIAESWLPQNPVTSCISSAGEGGLSFMAMQSPSSQIQTLKLQK